MAPGRDKSLDDRVNTYLAQAGFHRVLWLPPKPSSGRPVKLRVTYSDLGSTEPRTVDGAPTPVVLYCGGMMSSRYAMAMVDQSAQEYGIRLLCVDRPGMGGSHPVGLKWRMETWVDTIHELLTTLSIPHITTLFAHSCGALYALTLLLHARSLLHPIHPHLVFLAPWVHPSSSKQHLLTVASWLPSAALNVGPKLILGVNKTIIPALSLSQGALQSSWGLLVPATREVASEADERKNWQGALGKRAFKYTEKEGVEGAAEEMKVCLRKGLMAQGEEEGNDYWGWGGWLEYSDVVKVLVQREREAGTTSQLRLDVRFAEDDALIGKTGAGWFEKCWTQEGSEGVLRYESRVVEGSDHDSITMGEGTTVEEICGLIREEVRKRASEEGNEV